MYVNDKKIYSLMKLGACLREESRDFYQDEIKSIIGSEMGVRPLRAPRSLYKIVYL